MNQHDKFVQQLADAACRVRLPEDHEPPVGFAARVLTGLRRERRLILWESFALGAVPVAALLTVACLVFTSVSRPGVEDADAIVQAMLESQFPSSLKGDNQ
jgi:hypothetical protein